MKIARNMTLAVTRTGFVSNALVLTPLILGTLVRLPQLGNGLDAYYQFRQSQTALLARSFQESGLGAFPGLLPIFGYESQVPMEFPLYQILGAAFGSAFGNLEFGLATLSLALFMMVHVVVLALLRAESRSTKILFGMLYQFLPFGVIWGTAPLPDTLSVLLGLFFVFFANRYSTTDSKLTLLLAIISLSLSALVKPTTWPLIVLLGIALSFREASGIKRVIVKVYGIAAIVSVALTAVWTYYSDEIKRANFFAANLSSDSLREWNFSTLQERLDLKLWDRIFFHFEQFIFPSAWGVLLFLLTILVFRNSAIDWKFFGILTLSAISPTLVFFNLFQVHSYYFLSSFFVYCLIFVFAVDTASTALKNKAALLNPGFLVLTLLFMWSQPEPLVWTKAQYELRSQSAAAADLESSTQLSDTIFVIHCDYDSTLLYQANRKGTMIPRWMIDEEEEQYIADQKIASDFYVHSCSGQINLSKLSLGGLREITVITENLVLVEKEK